MSILPFVIFFYFHKLIILSPYLTLNNSFSLLTTCILWTFPHNCLPFQSCYLLKPKSIHSCKTRETFGPGEHHTVCARAARIWMSVLCVFNPVVVESYSDCNTCAVKMRKREPIKVVRHIPRNVSCIGTRSGSAVQGTARSARKAQVSHHALCCRPMYTN